MHPNIKYELLEFEQLLSTEDQKTSGREADAILVDIIQKEVERIKQTFIHEVFTFEDERHLERYIQYHQQALIRFMDKIGLVDEKHFSPARQKIFYNGFEELLSFVERHFVKYFDQDAKAPEGYIAIARKDVQVNLKKIQKELTARNTDQRITDLLLRVLKKIIDIHSSQGITYRRVMYAKEVQKELFRVLQGKPEGGNIDEDLRSIMYYLNYNSTKVLTYHAHYISSLLDKAETRAEKIEKLSFALKNINQAQVKPDIRYNHHGAALRDQLNNYITEEIDYQERLQHLTNGPSERPNDNFLHGFKLKFEASVSQVAYLLRLFIETKIILNSNLTQILHFLVRYIVTKKAENISYASFRAKFYSVESGTKESVRNMLAGMIQYIDEN